MTLFWFTLIFLVAFGAISTVMPYRTRPDLFFSWTVPSGFRTTTAAKRIIAIYALAGWSGTALLLGLLPVMAPRVLNVAILVAVVIWFAAFFLGRKLSRSFAVAPTQVREATLSVRPRTLPGGIALVLGPFLILAAKGVEVYLRWDQIPARIPVHWGFQGPDRWVDRSAVSVAGLFFWMALMTVVFVWLAWATMFSSRRLSATGSNAEAEERFRRISAFGLLGMAYVLALALPPLPGMFLTLPLGPIPILTATLIFVVLMLMSGQGGTRLPGYTSVVSGAAPTGDGTSDSHWKLGILYYNPADPSLLVEKRFGIGWTLNFGNRWCWILLLAIVGAPLVMRFTLR